MLHSFVPGTDHDDGVLVRGCGEVEGLEGESCCVPGVLVWKGRGKVEAGSGI